MSQAAKWKAILDKKRKDPNCVFIFWFDDTLREAEAVLQQEPLANHDLLMSREVHSSQIVNKPAIFAEHYPLMQKEQELFVKLNLQQAEVWSALNGPLFKQFGSEKIIQMMKQLGAKEDDVIEHSMISKAIQNAQEKISKKVLINQTCTSQEEWMRRNWTNN